MDSKIKTHDTGEWVLVDSDVMSSLSNKYISRDSRGYITTRDKITKKNRYLSRLVMNCPVGMVVDHINHDILDNRKSNLRVCSQAENARNKRPYRRKSKHSYYKGVYYRKTSKYNSLFQAKIYHDGKLTYLGYFKKESDAAKAYDEAARKYHGQFAFTNFLDEKTENPLLRK